MKKLLCAFLLAATMVCCNTPQPATGSGPTIDATGTTGTATDSSTTGTAVTDTVRQR